MAQLPKDHSALCIQTWAWLQLYSTQCYFPAVLQGLFTTSSISHNSNEQLRSSSYSSIKAFSTGPQQGDADSITPSHSNTSSSSPSSSSTSTPKPSPLSKSPAGAVPAPVAVYSEAAALNRKARRQALWASMREAKIAAAREARRQARLDPDNAPDVLRAKQEARKAARQQGHSLFSPAATTATAAVVGDTPKPRVIEGICRRQNIKLGWKKLDFVLRMVRRSSVDDAMAQLSANPKVAAKYVMHAIANARNNAICAGGDPAKLWVAEAYVTKGLYQKRVAIMGRGYSGVKEKRQSHLNVKVRQLDDSDPAAVKMLRRSARQIAPMMMRQQWSREQSHSRLRLWSGRRLQQQAQPVAVM